MTESSVPHRAVRLAALIDLEARWENLRASRPTSPTGSLRQDLIVRQRAYEEFRVKLVEFNKNYTPPYVTDFARTTPVRLRAWCLKMRDLYRTFEHDSQIACPIHLLEKA